jgi:hypothetical protein
MRDPYPLQWPDGWRRTVPEDRRVPKFVGRFTTDRDAIYRQLGRRGSNVVITSDLPTKADGRPYANSRCSDPGVAVYWYETGRDGRPHERVLACDTWRQVEQNMRAINLTIEAMRGIDRWGCTEIVERAFAGFAALPPGGATSTKRPWRDVLGVVGVQYDSLDPDELMAIAKAKHRVLIKVHHTDNGGDPLLAAEINVAMSDAEEWFHTTANGVQQ